MKNAVVLVVSLFLLIGRQSVVLENDLQQKEIGGTVVSEIDGKPVAKALVYVVEGEEEALTNEKGGFRLNTFQKLPLQLSVEKPGFRKVKITVTAFSQGLLIRLPQKS